MSQEQGIDLPGGRMDTFLERLAEKLGVYARSAAVFGEPVERDGVTVIPVAKARWGFGGGGGRSRGKAAADKGIDGEGSGGGGGVIVSPVGYIELKDGESRFRHIHDPVARLLAGGFLALLIIRAIRSLTRGQ